MEFSIIKDALDHVAEKQKRSCSRTQEVIEQMTQEIERAVDKIQSTNDSDSQSEFKSILAELKSTMISLSPLTKLEGTQKELNVSFNKYVKLLEKSFHSDISKVYRDVGFDPHTLNVLIILHFYHKGLFDFGDYLSSESGVPKSYLKVLFVEMHHILEAMKSHDLGPALSWASSNADKLVSSDILLQLHGMQFLKLLQTRSIDESLQYARAHLAPFSCNSNYSADVQKLMSCVIWAENVDRSPCHELYSPANWDKLAEEVKKQFCHVIDQPSTSALGVIIAAGIQGLPSLLKYINSMGGRSQDWQSKEQFPVALELDKEFQFQSIFVCPVSKEQSSDANLPMEMACGHLLCRNSIIELIRDDGIIKCPYCPLGMTMALCQKLYL